MATENLQQMGVRFGKLALALEIDINDHVQNIATHVLREVVQRTPVDVGTARSNWQINLGSPSDRVTKAYRPFVPSRWRPRVLPYFSAGGTRGETQNMNPTLVLGGRILRIRRPEQPVYITNNLPYIERLADGSSIQSSAGLMFLGIAAGFAQANAELRFAAVSRTL